MFTSLLPDSLFTASQHQARVEQEQGEAGELKGEERVNICNDLHCSLDIVTIAGLGQGC